MTGCQGQDWASYQDGAPSTEGLAFVAIKVTEGTSYTNPRYASQLATARAARLVVIHYHFARPGATMQAQADFFLRKASIKPGDVIALDWEDTGVSSAEKDAWIRYVQARLPQTQVILYCNRDFWFNRDKSAFAGDGLWIADPNAPMGQPSIQAKWLFHQYSEASGIDRDYCPLTPAQLTEWAHAKETKMATLDADDKKYLESLVGHLPAAVWAVPLPEPGSKTGETHLTGDYLRYGDPHYRAIMAKLGAQAGLITALTTALKAGGSLTEQQATAAAEAGARAALAELGTVLTKES